MLNDEDMIHLDISLGFNFFVPRFKKNVLLGKHPPPQQPTAATGNAKKATANQI